MPQILSQRRIWKVGTISSGGNNKVKREKSEKWRRKKWKRKVATISYAGNNKVKREHEKKEEEKSESGREKWPLFPLVETIK